MICERVLEAVRSNHAELLIIGTQGKTEVGRMALGSIARRLLAKAPCPVMTIPPDAELWLQWAGCWRTVLAATDFSPASIGALKCAHQAALRRLITLHVSGCQKERDCSNCRGRLRFIAPFNESHTVPVEHLVISGSAGEVIADCAQKYAVDLIVLGSPANELAEEDLETSTILQVISNVSCPVLCVPVMHCAESTIALIQEVAFTQEVAFA
jgi:nucleotide-binding universal stress UspA family protein